MDDLVFAVCFLLLAVVVPFLGGHLLALLGGWRRVARTFRAQHHPTGIRLRRQSANFGLVNYGGCLTIHVGPQGLHFAILWPFRPGHPPLFIPWHAVHNAQYERRLN